MSHRGKGGSRQAIWCGQLWHRVWPAVLHNPLGKDGKPERVTGEVERHTKGKAPQLKCDVKKDSEKGRLTK